MSQFGLALAIYALAIVISMGVALLIKGIVVVLARTRPQPAPASAVTPMATPAAVAVAEGIPSDHIAAIAAAVYAMLGEQRIVHIEDLRHRGQHDWTAATRAAHHASHRPRHSGRR